MRDHRVTPTARELLDRLPEGYALGAAVEEIPEDADGALRILGDWGLPVLDIARGPYGVLRSLDHPGRMSGILARLADSGEEVTVLRLARSEGAPVLEWWRVTVARD